MDTAAVPDGEYEAIAGNREVPLAMRIMCAALARRDLKGRANFEPGELAHVVNVGSNSRTHLNRTIHSLVCWGIAVPGANCRHIGLSPAVCRHAAPAAGRSRREHG